MTMSCTARALALLPVAILLAPVPAAAGSFEVNAAAANEGPFGLEVTPGSSCALTVNQVVDEPAIAGDRTACSTITVKQGEVAGTSTFTAGDAIAFESFSVAAGATFTAGIDTTLSPFAWVGDRIPGSVNNYLARFAINLDQASIGDDDRISVLEGIGGPGSWFKLVIKRNAALSENRLVVEARANDGSTVTTPFGEELVVPAGFSSVEMRWTADAGTGTLLVSLDSGPPVGLIGLSNSSGRVDAVRFGAVSGEPAASTGSYYLDSFESFRAATP